MWDALKSRERSQITRPGVCLRTPHTPTQPRRRAEPSAGPPKNSAPCIAKTPSLRACGTAAAARPWGTGGPRSRRALRQFQRSIYRRNPSTLWHIERGALRAHSLPASALQKTYNSFPLNDSDESQKAQNTRQISGTSPNGPRSGSLVA